MLRLNLNIDVNVKGFLASSAVRHSSSHINLLISRYKCIVNRQTTYVQTALRKNTFCLSKCIFHYLRSKSNFLHFCTVNITQYCIMLACVTWDHHLAADPNGYWKKNYYQFSDRLTKALYCTVMIIQSDSILYRLTTTFQINNNLQVTHPRSLHAINMQPYFFVLLSHFVIVGSFYI